MGHELKRKFTSETQEERLHCRTLHGWWFQHKLLYSGQWHCYPLESLGLMELMNALPLSLWSVHPWSEVHCPQIDLKHYQLWACWLWQVVLCWRAGDPSTHPPTHNPPLNAVSHSDKGGIRSRSCHEGKGACTACTSFNSLYPEQTGRQRHRNLPTFEWLPTRWDAGNLYTQWSTRCFGEKGEQIVCTWWEEVLNVWHVADQNVLNIVFLWLTE